MAVSGFVSTPSVLPGKTELAKQVADYIHAENAEGFIRIDMTEYQNQHEACPYRLHLFTGEMCLVFPLHRFGGVGGRGGATVEWGVG